MDFTVGIISGNLAIPSNFETVGISHFSRHGESRVILDTCLQTLV